MKVKGVFRLVLGLLAFYVISTVLLKSFNNSSIATPVQSVIREKRLNPSAFFYSDNLFIDTTDVDVTIR